MRAALRSKVKCAHPSRERAKPQCLPRQKGRASQPPTHPHPTHAQADCALARNRAPSPDDLSSRLPPAAQTLPLPKSTDAKRKPSHHKSSGDRRRRLHRARSREQERMTTHLRVHPCVPSSTRTRVHLAQPRPGRNTKRGGVRERGHPRPPHALTLRSAPSLTLLVGDRDERDGDCEWPMRGACECERSAKKTQAAATRGGRTHSHQPPPRARWRRTWPCGW